VPLGSRMVLEGGEVLRVMGAGTHVHAPWPFASRLSLDDGRIRETVLGDPESLMPALPAQATPSAAYDRLWDAAHPAEAVFVVAARSAAGAGQGFRVVAGDVRVQWRIGGSDADAIALVGHLTEPEVLVARTARRALATTFAQKSMEALMAEDRDQIGSFLRARIQADLDRLAGGSGLEVMAVIVDALHPPVGAAAAYHRVQSAEIEARAAVARSRGEASRKTSVAEVDAVHRVAAAQATAYETSAKARGDALRFAADHRAWAANREAMATERWLDAVRDGLIGKPVLVLDHRLDLGEVPVLDLRSSTPERRP